MWLTTLEEGEPHSGAEDVVLASLENHFGVITSPAPGRVCVIGRNRVAFGKATTRRLGKLVPDVLLNVQQPNTKYITVFVVEISNHQSYSAVHLKVANYFQAGSHIQRCLVIKLWMDKIVAQTPCSFAALAVEYAKNQGGTGCTPVKALMFGTKEGKKPPQIPARIFNPSLDANGNYVPRVWDTPHQHRHCWHVCGYTILCTRSQPFAGQHPRQCSTRSLHLGFVRYLLCTLVV